MIATAARPRGVATSRDLAVRIDAILDRETRSRRILGGRNKRRIELAHGPTNAIGGSVIAVRWMQDFVDSKDIVTRDELRDAISGQTPNYTSTLHQHVV